VVVVCEGHGVVGDPPRDVDAAAPDAGAGAVRRRRRHARRVVAVGHAAGGVGVAVAAALGALALGVADGVAADDDELVVRGGDAVHAVPVELHVGGAPLGDAGPVLGGGVVALPRDGEQHACLHRGDGEVAERDVRRVAGEHRVAAVARDGEAPPGALHPDAERVLDFYAAAAAAALWTAGGDLSSRRGQICH